MKATIEKVTTVEVDIKTVRMVIRIHDDDMPKDFPFRIGETWAACVDVETGKIQDWPKGVSQRLHIKVCDGGSYYLLDGAGSVVGAIEQDYVPHGVIPGEWGDYVILDIAEDGTIRNWKQRPHFGQFFESGD